MENTHELPEDTCGDEACDCRKADDMYHDMTVKWPAIKNPYYGQLVGDCEDAGKDDCCDSSKSYRPRLRGILVCYVNVGQLPVEKAIKHVEAYRGRLDSSGIISRLKDSGYEPLFMPVRHQDSCVELLKL